MKADWRGLGCNISKPLLNKISNETPMIKKIKRLLEVGETTKIGDYYTYTGGHSQVTYERKILSSSNPHFRETLVLELPPIPEGFRLMTEEDKKENLKGEIKFLFFGSEPCWSTSKESRAGFYELDEYLFIIKPKQKGFTIKDIAPGMTFYLDNTAYEVTVSNSINGISLRGFGVTNVAVINKHFSCLNSDGVITPCSEYQG